MRLPSLALAAALFVGAVGVSQAYEKPLSCSITSTGGTSAYSSACTIPVGVPLAVQCDAAACVRAVSSRGTVTVTCTAGQSNTGVRIAQDALFDVPMVYDSGNTTYNVDNIAVVGQGGATVHCEVLQVVTP